MAQAHGRREVQIHPSHSGRLDGHLSALRCFCFLPPWPPTKRSIPITLTVIFSDRCMLSSQCPIQLKMEYNLWTEKFYMWCKDNSWAGTIVLHLCGIPPKTFPLCSSAGDSQEDWRRRLVLKPCQKDAVQALLQKNPYPRVATREQLAWDLGILESRVQVNLNVFIHSLRVHDQKQSGLSNLESIFKVWKFAYKH